MVSIMKSLTQFAHTCLGLVLIFGSLTVFASAVTETMVENEAKVTEVLIPLSSSQIKQNISGPKRGTSMNTVQSTYGDAIKIHPAKGKPPITRWDYPEFSVYFESNSVIHTVSRSN